MPAPIDPLLQALTRVVNTLLEAEIPCAVAGGYAVHARGGPASDRDVDIFVKPADIERARHALGRAGLRLVDPPEDWLTRAYDGETPVDLIFRPNYRPVTDEILSRATRMRIGPVAAPVVSGADLLVDRLMVLDPHRLDFTALMHIARALRDQMDWSRVRADTAASPYARAFLGLLDDLGITDKGGLAMDAPADHEHLG
ncbi:nucleotidyltransferase family protein [Nocardia sp. NPDC051570]|uniref:nucleotidyltransferase family protein n=1 Tax=Nocardia sp. NPDC051570 TaxID=3364324 RepID=UPI0037ABD350